MGLLTDIRLQSEWPTIWVVACTECDFRREVWGKAAKQFAERWKEEHELQHSLTTQKPHKCEIGSGV